MNQFVDINSEAFWDVLFDEASVEGRQAERIKNKLNELAIYMNETDKYIKAADVMALINTNNRGTCDYFIVDQIENLCIEAKTISELKSNDYKGINIYEEVIKQDMPLLIEKICNVKRTPGTFYHDKETEVLEKFLEEKNIKASAELIRKINQELQKEALGLPFLYARAGAQYEYQLGRTPIFDTNKKLDLTDNLDEDIEY